MKLKHYFPRFSWLQIICLAILACMLAPVAMAASVTTAAHAPGTGSFLALAGLGLGGMMLRAPAGDPSTEGGAAPAADDDSKLSIGARLKAALSSKTDLAARIAGLETANATLTTDLAARDEELKGLRAKVTELEADAKQVSDALAKSEAEIKELSAREKDVGARADLLAKEKLGALGFPSSALPAPSEQGKDSDIPSSREELETALAKIPDATKQRELLNRYRAAQAANQPA